MATGSNGGAPLLPVTGYPTAVNTGLTLIKQVADLFLKQAEPVFATPVVACLADGDTTISDSALSPINDALSNLYTTHRPSSVANFSAIARTSAVTHGPNLKNFLTGLAIVSTFIGRIIDPETGAVNPGLLSLGIVFGILIMLANTFYNKEAALGAAAAVGWDSPSSLHEAGKRTTHLRNNSCWTFLNYLGDLAFGFTQGALIWNSAVDIMEIQAVKITFSAIIGASYVLSSPARLDTAFHAFSSLCCASSNFLQTLLVLVATGLICNPYMYASGAILLNLLTPFTGIMSTSLTGSFLSYAIGFLFSLPEFGIVYDKLNGAVNSVIGKDKDHSDTPETKESNCEHPCNFTASALILGTTSLSAILTYIMYMKDDFNTWLAGALSFLSALNSVAKIAALYMFTKEPGREGLSNALLIPARSNFDYLRANLKVLLQRWENNHNDPKLRQQVCEAFCFLLVFAEIKKGTDVYLRGEPNIESLNLAGNNPLYRSYVKTFSDEIAQDLINITKGFNGMSANDAIQAICNMSGLSVEPAPSVAVTVFAAAPAATADNPPLLAGMA